MDTLAAVSVLDHPRDPVVDGAIERIVRTVVLRSALSPWTGRRRYRAVLDGPGSWPGGAYVVRTLRFRTTSAVAGRGARTFALSVMADAAAPSRPAASRAAA